MRLRNTNQRTSAEQCTEHRSVCHGVESVMSLFLNLLIELSISFCACSMFVPAISLVSVRTANNGTCG